MNKSPNFIPITSSTPSAEGLAPFIEESYQLENVQCQLIKGLMLHSYLVTTGDGRFIFRIYPHARRTEAEIQEELVFLQHLDQHNIPVSVPIPTGDGRIHFPLNAPEGPRQAALFTYAPGQPFQEHTSAATMYNFGRLLAQLHQTAESFPKTGQRRPFNYQTLIEDPLTGLENIRPDRQSDWHYLREIAPELQAALEALTNNPAINTFIHGDLDANNIHITPEGAFTFFDFDLCGPGPRAFDIAAFLVDESAETAEAFLGGYQSVRALDTAEIEAIPLLQIAQNIWLLALRASYINEWGSAFLPDRFIDNILQTIQHRLENGFSWRS